MQHLFKLMRFHFQYYSRGRGSYRGRGRGNYYRQDRNSAQQHHQNQGQHNPNVPFYDQSMNLMNPNMASSGQGGFNDGIYHDTPMNRYDRIHIFSKINIKKPFKLNGYDENNDQMHSIKCYQLVYIYI